MRVKIDWSLSDNGRRSASAGDFVAFVSRRDDVAWWWLACNRTPTSAGYHKGWSRDPDVAVKRASAALRRLVKKYG